MKIALQNIDIADIDIAVKARRKTDPLNQNRSNCLMRRNLELDSVSFIMFFREIMCCVQKLLFSRATLSYQESISMFAQ